MQVSVRAIRKAASLKEAMKVLTGLQHLHLGDSVEVFNVLLRYVAGTQEWEQALHVFRHLTERGVSANTETYNALLCACVHGVLLATLSFQRDRPSLPCSSCAERDYSRPKHRADASKHSPSLHKQS
jgi:pentatricopeptide repeat protein